MSKLSNTTDNDSVFTTASDAMPNILSNILSGPSFGDMNASQASATGKQSSNTISPHEPAETPSGYFLQDATMDFQGHTANHKPDLPVTEIHSDCGIHLVPVRSPVRADREHAPPPFINTNTRQTIDHTNEGAAPNCYFVANDKVAIESPGHVIEQGKPHNIANGRPLGDTQHYDQQQENALICGFPFTQDLSSFVADAEGNVHPSAASGNSDSEPLAPGVCKSIYRYGDESYHLPRSSPQLDTASSPPPTSSPQIFTSSPCILSQSSATSVCIPELNLDSADCLQEASFSPSSDAVIAPSSTSIVDESMPHPSCCLPPFPFALAFPSTLAPTREPHEDQNAHSSQGLSSDAMRLSNSASVNSSPEPALEHPRLGTCYQERNLASTFSPQRLTSLPESVDDVGGQYSGKQGAWSAHDETNDLQPVHGRSDSPLEGETQRKPQTARIPAPKRPTFVSQNRAFKKLATPFRSPLMEGPKLEDSETISTTGVSATTPKLPSRSASPPSNPLTELQEIKEKSKGRENVNPNQILVDKKHRTVRAGAQFKSPLTLAAAASAKKSSIRLTPSIQILERKVQVLRRALKVKKECEEEVLRQLIKTWTEAGREVAYQLFELAREISGGSLGSGGVRKFEESWGWSTQEGTKRAKIEDQDGSWGWTTTTPESSTEGCGEVEVMNVGEDKPARGDFDEDDDKPEATVGTMLRQLGVDPTILGWDDKEGTFMD